MERWRFVPALALASVAALLLAGVLSTVYGERLYRAQREKSADVQIRMLAASVAEALEFEDVAAARDNVNALRTNPEIEAAGIYDATGALVAGYVRPGALPLATSLARSLQIKGNRIAMTMPVVHLGRRVGTVHLRTHIEPFARRLTRYGGIALLASMGSLVVIVLGMAHAALRRVNAELVAANQRLREEAAERAHAEEALRQAQKMQAVGQLTGGIAHDFNNLLTPITGGLEFLSGCLEDERMKRMANNALEAARRGVKLTSQLLAFSRVQRLGTSPVKINEVIEGMQTLLAHAIGATVAVRLELDPEAGRAMCDANQLENAILNLAINARDAMPLGGTLTISTGREQAPDGTAYVAVIVADTGTGMSPDVLARATEPFFTTKPLGQGTGLGLAQVYAIVHQYDGMMRIDSREGEGTDVRIFLPLASAAATAKPTDGGDRAAHGEERGFGADILVIDDDGEVRQFLTDTLEALGYRVRSADGGDAGLRMLDAAAPDLLLIDFAMPGRNGAEVSRAVRARHPALPIVFITGYAETASIQAALGEDAPVLRKPFGVDDLVETIDGQLARSTKSVPMARERA